MQCFIRLLLLLLLLGKAFCFKFLEEAVETANTPATATGYCWVLAASRWRSP
jgi:hypothetical protein